MLTLHEHFRSGYSLFSNIMCISTFHLSNSCEVIPMNRGRKSGEATQRSVHESFDAGPGNQKRLSL